MVSTRHNPQSKLWMQYTSWSSRIRGIDQYHENNDYEVHTYKKVTIFKPAVECSKLSLASNSAVVLSLWIRSLHDNLTFNFSLAPSNPQQALQSGYLYESYLLQVSRLNLFSRLLKLFYDFLLFLSFYGNQIIFLWNEWVPYVQEWLYVSPPQTQHCACVFSYPILADCWLSDSKNRRPFCFQSTGKHLSRG